MTITIIAKCDWCEGEETFDSAEEFDLGWWTVFPPHDEDTEDFEDPEKIYCSQACLVSDLS